MRVTNNRLLEEIHVLDAKRSASESSTFLAQLVAGAGVSGITGGLLSFGSLILEPTSSTTSFQLLYLAFIILLSFAMAITATSEFIDSKRLSNQEA